MTPTHHTRDGRPVTIDKIGKRWMRGQIVQEGATFRPRWHLNGEHPRDEALDLTPVAAPEPATRPFECWANWYPQKRDWGSAYLSRSEAETNKAQLDAYPVHMVEAAEIERLRGMNAEFVAFFQNVRPWMGQTSREKFDTILARNGGKP